MAMLTDQKFTYLIRHNEADGEHLATIDGTRWNDELANQRAAEQFGDRLISVERSDDVKVEAARKALLAKYAARTPLEEKTGGQMNRIIDNPELAEAD